jgi:5'-3' exonuclease
MATIGNHTNIPVEEDLLRHMVLNAIRSYNVKFRDEYGQMIIACDDRRSWRKEMFPYYKANRHKDREESEIDWNTVFEVLNKVRDELKEYFPYKVIHIDRAEADDIIGTIVHENGDTLEKIMIVSGDKDFRQLQTYTNVKQYDPTRKKYLEERNPDRYLREHILRGDRGDGVPNFLSQDDCFVVGVRQKQLRDAKVDLWVNQKPEEFCDEVMLKRYNRNKQMVDLSLIPDDIKSSIKQEFANQQEIKKNRNVLFNYFIEHKLKHLIENINEF